MKSLSRIRTFEQFSSWIAMTPGPRPRNVWGSMTAGQSPEYERPPDSGRVPRGIVGGPTTAGALVGALAAVRAVPLGALGATISPRPRSDAAGSMDGDAIVLAGVAAGGESEGASASGGVSAVKIRAQAKTTRPIAGIAQS